MKKFLLPLVAVCAVAPAYADTEYGTTPETAKPFPSAGWSIPDAATLSTLPDEVYFTITNTLSTPAMWGATPSNDKQLYVYLSDGGQEAFQMVGSEGSNTYILLPEYEYLVKITPKDVGTYCLNLPYNPAFMSLPPKWEGKYKYYPKHINNGGGITVQPGETQWVEIDITYATDLVLMQMPPFVIGSVNDIEKIEAIHIEATGGSNVGDGLFAPVVKKGKNVIGFTAKADAASEIFFCLTQNAFSYTCEKNLLRGGSMILDEKETYMDAYYTVDRFFTVPQDGSYTFTNHGAKGTTLTVGNIKLTDPNNEFAYECDWDNAKTATVGDNDAKVVMENLKKGDNVFVRSDAFTTLDGGIDNQPYVMVTKGGQSGIADITADGAKLNVSVNGGVLTVESALLVSGAEVAVYDMLGRKVAAAAAPAGAASIELNLNAAPGVYVVAVQGNAGSESAKIAVK